ncbi:MAG: hypothetical protein Q7U75_02165 [Desulfobacterales bacterium]|nr:hypothetical protein [Desulfobacterales bacterium]
MILLKAVSPKEDALVRAISTRILSLSYEDVDSGQDTLKLEVDNDDLALFGFPDIYQADAIIVQWGDPGNLTAPRKFRIKEIAGFLVWTLTATGEMWSGDQVAVRRIWDQEEVTEIVRKISAEMGYENPEVQEPEEMVFLTRQQFEPNARFLQRLAAEFGYAFWIDSKLHWVSRDVNGTPRRMLVFRGTSEPSSPGIVIGTPSVKFQFTRTKPQTVKGVSTENKAETKPGSAAVQPTLWTPSATGGPPRITTNGYGTLEYSSGTSAAKALFAEGKLLPAKHTETVYTPSGKPQKAGGMWRGKQDSASVEVTIVGIGDLSVGAVMELANFGAINDGKWYVRKVTHKQAADGFTQSLSLTRDSGKKAGKNAKDVPGKVNRVAAAGEKGTAGVPDNRPKEVRIIGNQYGTLETVERKEPASFTRFMERFGEKPEVKK